MRFNRRVHGPLGALIIVQLVLAFVAPSISHHVTPSAGEGVERVDLRVSGDTSSETASPDMTVGTDAATVAGESTRRSPAASSRSLVESARRGDTSHCVAGRQFDPAIDYYAPPCVPGVPGAKFPDNGGATAQGVTADRITIVNYVQYLDPATEAAAKAQGIHHSRDDLAVMNAAFANFINKHYALYGRKVHIETVQGTCKTAPPDMNCLGPELSGIVAKYKPYAFQFLTTCSPCFQELARLKVVAMGLMAGSDEFRAANAPYLYHHGASTTRVALEFADWWCAQMTSNTNDRVVTYAGTQNRAQNFNGRRRVLGVIGPRDADAQRTIKSVLYPALERCGDKVTHEYFYVTDISTAANQVNAAVSNMNTAENPATSVLCLCQSIAAALFYNGFQQHNYWPEILFSDNQLLDWDTAGQDNSPPDNEPTLGCPTPPQGCQFDGALGLSESAPPEPEHDNTAVRVFRAGGGKNPPITGATALSVWSNYNMLASLIQATGPVLTPARMHAAAPTLGRRGGGASNMPLRTFEDGTYAWTKDMRLVYWNKHQPSPYNGRRGTYVAVGGMRFGLGEFPVLKSPPIPVAADRR